ncbi:MAG: isopeptide-forming domain-containing fimbrial protein [Ruminococcus sp.]|nr:isopeptide-forming domain-containing fimbrial protein [Ruminococcus sp.]
MKVKFNQFKTKLTRNSDSKGSNIMKKNRKLTALLVAACMTIPMAATTFTVPMMASGATTTITLSEENSSLQAYQIFKGTYANGALGVTDWGDAFAGNPQNFVNALKADNAVFGNGDANIFKDATTAIDVADVLGEHSAHDSNVAKEFVRLAKKNIQADRFVQGKKTENNKTTIDLDDGYYLFADNENPTSDVWSFGLLKVVGNGAGSDVSEKRALPIVTKQVREAETDSYADYADCEIGEYANFKITCSIPASDDNLEYYLAYYLEIQDALGDAFNTPEDIKIKFGDDSEISLSNTITTDTEISDKEYYYSLNNNDITIKMENVKAYAGKDIVLTYKAKLNSSAQTGNNAFESDETQNINSVKIKYTNNPYNVWDPKTENTCDIPDGNNITTDESTDAIAKVFTYQLDIHKFATDNPNGWLAGATFVLRDSDDNNADYLIKDGNGNWYWDNDENKAEKFTSDNVKNISIKGLDSDTTYYLEETVAPGGYNKLTNRTAVTINATFNTTADLTDLTLNSKSDTGNKDTGIVTLDVENKKGATLPETGGIGTKIFYILGGTLVIGSGAALVIKKRMGKDEE